MKKLLSLLIAVLMLCTILPSSYALTDLSTFDYQTILGNREGYSYDKFEKSWSYYGAYAKYYNDATLVIGIQTGSMSNGTNPAVTQLYVKIMDKSGKILYNVETIDFLIGDDLYSYKSMIPGDVNSSVVIAERGLLLLKAIEESNVSDVAVKIGTKEQGSITIDNLDSTEYNELKEFCRVYLKYNLWDYCDNKEQLNSWEETWPLYINGEKVTLDKEAA